MGFRSITTFSLAVALASFSVSGFAQQNNTFKVKSSPSEKEPKKAAPIGNVGSGKGSGSATASSANAKDLQAVEHQTAKGSATSKAGGKKAGTSAAIKPVKDKPNPPINFGGASGKNQGGRTVTDPYRGRLKQKHSHQ
jgi:hypothetical protein